MAAANHNFSIESGSDFQIIFQYLDANGNPVDLSSYCASLLWRPSQGFGSPQGFSSSQSSTSLIDSGWTLVKETGGRIVFSLSYTFTKAITWNQAVYDLYLTDSSVPPKKYRISTGTIDKILNNFPECDTSTSGFCSDCANLEFTPPEPEPTPVVTSSVSITAPIPTPSSFAEMDLCSLVCNELDIYSVMYNGSGISINDNSISSGTINIANTGTIQNIELMINKLKHAYPQDLAMILVPPTGDKILLTAHNKISHNNISQGFNCVFSNKAASGVYINNVTNNIYSIPYVNILDKTSTYKYNNETLSTNLQSWIGSSPSGDWTLLVKDDDIGTSGSIESWQLVVTYEPPPLTIDSI